MDNFFKISRSERPKIIQFILLAAIIQAGITIGITAADSLFLSNLGVESLPYIYVVMPVIMIIYASLFSYLISILGIRKLVLSALAIVSIISFLLFILLLFRRVFSPEHLHALYFGIKIFTTVTFLAFYSLYWNFTDLYFDLMEGKRVYAYLAGGSALGVIIGGTITTYSADMFGISYLFLFWSVIGAFAIPIVYRITNSYTEIEADHVAEEDSESMLVLLKKHWGSIFKIRYVALLAGMVFLVSLLAGLAEYQYYEIFSATFTESELAKELGKLFAFVNIFNLIVCVFLFNRLVLTFGVTNIAMIQPVIYILAFSFLLLENSYWAAVFAFVAYQGMASSVDNNNYNLMYNALPNENRAQLRTILEGLLEPTATALAGLFLLYYASRIPPEGISLFGFIAALLLFVIVILVKRNYLESIVRNLKSEWLDFSRNIRHLVSPVKEADLKYLEKKSNDMPDKAIIAIRILRLNRSGATLPSLLTLIEKYQRKGHFDEMGNALKEEIHMLIRENDYEVILRVLDWFESQKDFDHPEMMEALAVHRLIQSGKTKHLLGSPDPAKKGIALTAMLLSPELSDVNESLSCIEEMLKGRKGDILTAIRVLGNAGNQQFSNYIQPFLRYDDKDIRRTAMHSLKSGVNEHSFALIQPVLESMKKPGGRNKLSGFQILRKINDPICVIPLLQMSHTFNPYERRKAEELISEMGDIIVPQVVKVFRDSSEHYHSRSLAGKILFKVSPDQFELSYKHIIDDEIRIVYQTLHNYNLLLISNFRGGGVDLLLRFYKDLRQIKINFILETLTIIGQLPAYELIANSLRSTNPKTRSYAIEALEQGVERSIFSKLFPLVDRRPLEKILLSVNGTVDIQNDTADDVVLYASNSIQSLEKAAAMVIFSDHQLPGTAELIRSGLHLQDDLLVRDTAIQLLDNGDGFSGSNHLYKLIKFVQSRFFQDFQIDELEFLALRSVLMEHSSGDLIYEADNPAEYMYLIVEGSVECFQTKSVVNTLSAGDVFGTEVYKGSSDRTSTVKSCGSATLTIDYQSFRDCCRLFPGFGIKMLLRGIS